MSKFYEEYKKREDELRRECDEQVESGELTQEEANFRFYFVRDEILEDMPDDLEYGE